MKREIIGESAARLLLEPHFESIANSFINAFNDTSKVNAFLRKQNPDIFNETFSLTRSVQMWNYSVNWAREFFKDSKDVEFVEQAYNTRWFNFSDLIFLRFKKFNESLK